MPFTQVYEDITPQCEVEANHLITIVGLETDSHVLRMRRRCLVCISESTLHYDLHNRRYVDKVSLKEMLQISYACNRRWCDSVADVPKLEFGERHLRIQFRCRACRGRATRHYDLVQRGFADVTGRIVPQFPNLWGPRNRCRYVGIRPCECRTECPRPEVRAVTQFHKLLDQPITPVRGIVSVVAEKCQALNERELTRCTDLLFGEKCSDIQRELFQGTYKETQGDAGG